MYYQPGIDVCVDVCVDVEQYNGEEEQSPRTPWPQS